MNSFGLTTLIQFLREDDPDRGGGEPVGPRRAGRALITAGRDRVSRGADPVPSRVSRDRCDGRKPTTNELNERFTSSNLPAVPSILTA